MKRAQQDDDEQSRPAKPLDEAILDLSESLASLASRAGRGELAQRVRATSRTLRTGTKFLGRVLLAGRDLLDEVRK